MLKKHLFSLCLGLGIALIWPGIGMIASVPSQPLPLTQVQPQGQSWGSSLERDLGLDDQLWGRTNDRQALITAINHSLRYLETPKAIAAYRQYPVPGITRDRVRRSLLRFRQLLMTSRNATQLREAVQREFVLYQSVGKDGQGTVAFTGYFEPIYQASRQRTAEYRYPLYRLPSNFATWSTPHPTRAELEGEDGLGTSRLWGTELVWLRDRFQAFLVHVQGSARLQLPNGQTMTVGYAGKTNYPYTGVGRELVKDGKLKLEDLTLQALIAYFQTQPEEMNQYLPRNRSFVFFRETFGSPATGSLSVPVTPERSIATDKSLMPPGALALIHAPLPRLAPTGGFENQVVSRYVLDQDTGSAIRSAGRVDLFMGTGDRAGEKAGLINASGQLYYLLLKR